MAAHPTLVFQPYIWQAFSATEREVLDLLKHFAGAWFNQYLMHIQAVLFDLDGTLLDTLDDLATSVNQFLSQNDFPERSLDELRACLGNGAAELLQCALPERVADDRLQDYLEEYKAIYKKNLTARTKPYPGIVEMLKGLRERGIRTGVISNKPDWAARQLSELAFGDLLDLSMGDRPGEIERKPNKAPLVFAMKELGVDPAGTIYVGDSEVDIETARNTGIDVISVSWGFRDRSELEQEHPDYLIDTPAELLAVIDKLQKSRPK